MEWSTGWLMRSSEKELKQPYCGGSAMCVLLLTEPALTWCGILCDFEGVQRGSQARTIRKYSNPLPCQLLRWVPVEGKRHTQTTKCQEPHTQPRATQDLTWSSVYVETWFAYTAQAGLALTISWAQSPVCWDYRCSLFNFMFVKT